MAREHARIFCSIWNPESDFVDFTADAQRLFFLLMSQQELNNAGVIPLMVSKWARRSKHTTVADIEKALAELVEARYVLVDSDTEELLIRSHLRRDEVMKHPYMRKSALRAVEQIESPMLRREAAAELRRIGHPEGIATASILDPDPTPTTRRDGIESGTSTTRPDPVATASGPHPDGSSTTRRDGIPMGSPQPVATVKGEGEGKGRGNVPVPATSVSRSARATIDERSAVRDALLDRTGKKINDEHHLDAVIRQLLDGRPGINDRVRYLRGAITRDPDPDRFLPTPQPPRFQPAPPPEPGTAP